MPDRFPHTLTARHFCRRATVMTVPALILGGPAFHPLRLPTPLHTRRPSSRQAAATSCIWPPPWACPC